MPGGRRGLAESTARRRRGAPARRALQRSAVCAVVTESRASSPGCGPGRQRQRRSDRRRCMRAERRARPAALVRVSGDDGRLLAREQLNSTPGIRGADVRLPMPSELRNRATRVEIEGESIGRRGDAARRALAPPAGRHRRHAPAQAASRCSPAPTISKGAQPVQRGREGAIDDLLKREIAMLVLADTAPGTQAEHDALVKWMEDGGVVLRFAGPDLAEKRDDLLPVTLRRGGRTIGGALSWETAGASWPRSAATALRRARDPEDVTIARQVLAEPSLDLGGKTWARLTDGTPLVTAERRGKGWLVLVHTTGEPGVVEPGALRALRRDAAADRRAEPGRGRRGRQAAAAARDARRLGPAAARAGECPADRRQGYRRPRRLAAPSARLLRRGRCPPGAQPLERGEDSTRSSNAAARRRARDATRGRARSISAQRCWRGRWLLRPRSTSHRLCAARAAARIRPPSVRRGAAAVAAARVAARPAAHCAGAARRRLRAAGDLGDPPRLCPDRRPDVDEVSRAGLTGLTNVLNRRTAVEAAEPMEVDIEQDELIFFPLLYWPVAPGRRRCRPQAVERLNRFLATGGTILFDTRDQGEEAPGPFGAGAAQPAAAPDRRRARRSRP